MSKSKDYVNDTAIQAIIQMGTKLKRAENWKEKFFDLKREFENTCKICGLYYYDFAFNTCLDDLNEYVIEDTEKAQKFVDKLQEFINKKVEYENENNDDDSDDNDDDHYDSNELSNEDYD